MGNLYEIYLASPGSVLTSNSYAGSSTTLSMSEENISEASTREGALGPTYAEISCYAPVQFFEKQGQHQNLREQLAVLWKNGEQVRSDLCREMLKNTKFTEDFQSLNARIMCGNDIYLALENQKKQCDILSHQQMELQNDPNVDLALFVELDAYLEKNLFQLEKMKTEWPGRERELELACQEQAQLQQEYDIYLATLIPLQEMMEQIWRDVEILLNEEKQNIKNMLAEGRKYPLANQENLESIPFFINDFEADLVQSYATLAPSVYQMLRISLFVRANFIDPLQQDLTDQEIFIINKIITLKQKFSIEDDAALAQMFSIKEIILLENIISKEIENVFGKLAQEKSLNFFKNSTKIKNMNSYLQALNASYHEISKAHQEVIQKKNIWLGYLPSLSMNHMA